MTHTEEIIEQTLEGHRLSEDEALYLFAEGDLLDLGRAANEIANRLHPENIATFIIDRNINYTNVCVSRCKFCAFYRERFHPEAYLLTQKEIFEKIEETLALGGTQIMLQGGLHPDLDLEYFEELLASIKSRYQIEIHSFSPPEIFHLADQSNLPIRKVLQRLQAAGLDSLPGGGAEILVDGVRQVISPHKITANQWLEVMETAHQLGMSTTATMMLGSVETPADRIAHLSKLRALQDRTGGFRAFIPWTFQPGHTELGGQHTSSIDYLRTLAIARLFLDNFPHIQGSWVTQGPRIGQLTLLFGGDDLGSIMIEENVVRSTGVSYKISKEEMIRLIRATGKIPAQRDTRYQIIQVFDQEVE
ncbi:MAG: dehypoxanthine futalosine cyclase [Firmicutes bacterium]|nr:dehypoxanthine futalosine cyclase [Bacillota bacterium]